MLSIMRRILTNKRSESDDEVLGWDMVPSPSVLAAMCDPQIDGGVIKPAPSVELGPFTTMAQAPIRES